METNFPFALFLLPSFFVVAVSFAHSTHKTICLLFLCTATISIGHCVVAEVVELNTEFFRRRELFSHKSTARFFDLTDELRSAMLCRRDFHPNQNQI